MSLGQHKALPGNGFSGFSQGRQHIWCKGALRPGAVLHAA
jgi:hypothetical protein